MPTTRPWPSAVSLDAATKLTLANALGARVIRMATSSTSPTPPDATYTTLMAHFPILLTIQSRPVGGGPATVPADLGAYQTTLGAIVDQYHPAVIFVENEELALEFYASPASDYVNQLAAAITSGHAHGTKVADGAITGLPLALATWHDLWTSGDLASADAFAQEVLKNDTKFTRNIDYTTDLPSAASPTTPILSAHKQQLRQLQDAEYLMSQFATMPLDYVNFHAYQLPEARLAQMIALYARKTGKPVITGELGQYDVDPATTIAMLSAVATAQLPYAIWFDGDGDPAFALQSDASATSFTLRSNGAAFAAFVTSH